MLSVPGGGAEFNVSSPIQEEPEAAIDPYRKVVVLYAEMSGKIVLSVAGWQGVGTTRKEARNWSIAALQGIAKTAAGHRITMCIEPTSADSNLVDSADDALQMMNGVGAANVKLIFDTDHTITAVKWPPTKCSVLERTLPTFISPTASGCPPMKALA
jgi:protein FrlC